MSTRVIRWLCICSLNQKHIVFGGVRSVYIKVGQVLDWVRVRVVYTVNSVKCIRSKIPYFSSLSACFEFNQFWSASGTKSYQIFFPQFFSVIIFSLQQFRQFNKIVYFRKYFRKYFFPYFTPERIYRNCNCRFVRI